MQTQQNGIIRALRFGNLQVEAYESTEAMGKGAAAAAAECLLALAAQNDTIGVIFATGASQIPTLKALTEIPGLPWEKVVGFHMDDYLGMSEQNPASFRRYLQERLTDKVKLRDFHWIGATANNVEEAAQRYTKLLAQFRPQLCLLGIGENGHLAFNDPAVADFNDPTDVKLVSLDEKCRQQQANEGWFKSISDVPDVAITMTIPALFRVPRLIASVPDARKADIVRRSLTEEISTSCPATILRKHPNATLYLDPASAAKLPAVSD